MHLRRIIVPATFALSSFACSSTSSPGTTGTTGGSDGGASDTSPDQILAAGGCAAPTGAGTEHSGDISADETWTAATGPHHVTSALRVLGTLTIEPCATVSIAAGVSIEIGSSSASGKLVAHGDGSGDSVRSIRFLADGAAPWGQLLVNAKASIDLSLSAIVQGGGDVSGERGALLLLGVAGGTNDGDITRSAALDRVVIEKSASYGINLDGYATFAASSQNVWIRSSGSTDYPSAVRLEPGIAGTLPRTLSATGNVRDEILLSTNKTFMHDDTLPAIGLPFRAHGTLYVNPSADGAAVTLTVEPGVTLGFDDHAGSGMLVGSTDKRQGILVAVGTASAPITFTSGKTQKAAGDWSNITFRYTGATNHISNATIAYAGGDSGTNSFGCGPKSNDSAIIVYGQGAGSAGIGQFVDHTTFDDIAGTTVIVSGWTDDQGPNLATANTFGPATPSCKVSRPHRTGGGDTCDGGRTTCWSP